MTEGVGDDGNEGGEWASSLPEGVREWQEVKDSKSEDSFWDQMGNMRSRMGNSITLPGDDEEAQTAFYQKLQDKVPGLQKTPDYSNADTVQATLRQMGAPESVEGYTAIEGIPDDRMALLKEVAHKHSLPDSIFNGMITEIAKADAQADFDNSESFNADLQALKQDWGMTWKGRTEAILSLAQQTGAPQAMLDALQDGKANASTLKWMQGLTEALTGEGGTIQLQEPTNDTRVTPDTAKLEIAAIRNNKDHPYNNKQDPSHEMAKKHVGELYVKAYPNLREEGESHTQFGVG